MLKQEIAPHSVLQIFGKISKILTGKLAKPTLPLILLMPKVLNESQEIQFYSSSF